MRDTSSRRTATPALIGVAVLLIGAASGCGSQSARTGTPSTTAATHSAPAATSSGESLSALLSLLHRCTVVNGSEVASAYDAAFSRGEVSSIFGTRESPVSTAYEPPGTEPPAVDSCEYTGTLAGYGSYDLYTVEWTVDPTAIAGYLSHRSLRPGDSGFALVSPPPDFTTAYEDNGGLFLARSGIAITLGGALGSGVNGPLDAHAAARISTCLARQHC